MIMAGGTGGHVFPALAVADHLRALGWRVVWLGARTGMEATLVPKHGYEMAWVRFSGLRGKGLVAKLLLPLNLLVAFWQALRALRAHAPGRRARDGRLHRVSGRNDGGAPRPAARDPRAELDRRAREPRARGRRRSRAGRVPGRAAQCDVRRQPGARGDRASCAARRAVRRARRAAAHPGGRRKPGCGRAERHRAQGAGAAAGRSAASRHASIRREARRRAARELRARRASMRTRSRSSTTWRGRTPTPTW